VFREAEHNTANADRGIAIPNPSWTSVWTFVMGACRHRQGEH